jgi:NADH-quinone oxidoreductase subunit K
MVPPSYYLVLSAILFVLGVIGVLVRRNVLVLLMSVEMMLNAVNLTLITYSRLLGDIGGQVFALLVMAVAAAEVAVGLAIVVSLFRHKKRSGEEYSANVDEMNLLRW